jgi:hypothetical protein
MHWLGLGGATTQAGGEALPQLQLLVDRASQGG